ncbi:hypothetical protein K502DRAFT_331836 [Neoconidiobolus thromboides FSU 785]|nr:hypothetical protein K502DRAFT_331836 [Neoconidiobolus thromboides FSU 785]
MYSITTLFRKNLNNPLKEIDFDDTFKNQYDIDFLDNNDTFLKKWIAFNNLKHNEKLKFTIFTYNHLLRGLSFDTGKFKTEAEKLFRHLEAGTLYGVKADINTYNLMLMFYSHNNDYNNVESIFNKILKNMHLKPNIITFNSLLKAYSKNEGNLNKMEKILYKVMPKYDVEPSCITYTILLSGCCQNRNLEKGYKFRNHMGKFNIIPDTKFYNSLLKLYSICNVDYGTVLNLYEDLLKGNVKLDRFSYGHLLETLTKQGQNEVAVKIFNEMLKSKIEPNVYIMELLKLSPLELLDNMKEANMEPSPKFYNTLLNNTVKSGDYLLSFKIINHMRENLLEPTVHSYNILMDTYLSLKKPDKCLELFDEMKEKGIKGDSYIYRSMIGAAGLKEDIELAIKYLDEAKQENIPPNTFLYNSVLNICARTRNKSKCKEMFNRMESEGLNGNIDSYNYLLQTLNGQNDFSQGWKLYKLMLSKKVVPNKVTYIYLNKLCYDKMDVAKSLEIYYAMQASKDCKPDTISCDKLMKVLHNMNQSNKAFEIFINFISNNEVLILNNQIINTFLVLCLDNNNYRTAIATFDKLIHLIKINKMGDLHLNPSVYLNYLELLLRNEQNEAFYKALNDSTLYFNVKFVKSEIESLSKYIDDSDVQFNNYLSSLPSNLDL